MTAKDQPLELSVPRLLRWVALPTVAAAAFGILPTWLMAGWAGVAGGLLAVGLVLGVMVATGSFTVYAAKQGAGPASTTFLGCSLLRMILCPVLVGTAWWISDLPFNPMAVWLVIAYIFCLALEVVWLVLALRHGPARAARDKADPPAPAHTPQSEQDDDSGRD
jgi:hypothetical protein